MAAEPSNGAPTTFLAGASGVIGVRLVPLLVSAGHRVVGLTRSPGKVEALRALGCEPVVGDVFDAERLLAIVAASDAGTVIDQLTDLPDVAADIPKTGGANARVRREGTHNLVAAARAAGIARYLAQSVAWPLAGDGAAAVAEREQLVLGAGGVVVRYGQFYGPGTHHPAAPPDPPRIHIDAAARRTMDVLDAPAGVVVIAD